MQTIGIIAATEDEILAVKSKMEIISAKNIIGIDFFMGKMFNKSAVLVRCGIGKVNAAVCTQILIDMYAIDFIISIGIGDAALKNLDIGDVVISNDTVQYDFDMSAPPDYPLFMGRIDRIYYEADYDMVQNAMRAFSVTNSDKKAVVGRIASGDRFISDIQSKEKIKTAFDAICIDMDGAAIAQAAYLNMIPFVIIRVILKRFDDDTHLDINSVTKSAAASVLCMLEGMFEVL